MNPILQHDADQLAYLLELARRQATGYLTTINDQPTGRPSANLPLSELPESGQGAESALFRFQQTLAPLLVASSGPRYWGFVTGGTTPAALIGDWLTSVYDQNPQSASGSADRSALIELDTLHLYRSLLGLPHSFTGGFVTGATMSNFTCLGVARQWAGAQLGVDVARFGVPSGIRILSGTPHSSSVKSLAMLGLGSAQLTPVEVLPDREAMDMAHLETLLDQYQHEPIILISSGGTVNTVDFDDLAAIAALKTRYRFWWHIDAAFGGFAAVSPDHRHLLTGWEQADSITIDNHKWLNVPYDSAVYLIRDTALQQQVETFQNTSAPYLGDLSAEFSYLNAGPENSRRLRALPTWMALMAYGRDGQRDIVERNIGHARQLGSLITQSRFFQLEAPVRLNVVCFSLKQHRSDRDRLMALQQQLSQRGRVFMTPTVYKGVWCLRAAFVNWQTTDSDIDLAWQELESLVQ